MTTRLYPVLVLVSALLASFSASAQTAVEPPGAGTAQSPYQISLMEHLVWMGEHVDVSAGQYYALQNDIDASDTTNWNGGAGFVPIGTGNEYGGLLEPFMGVFDGCGFTISNLSIYLPAQGGVGLFGFMGSSGVVKNVGLPGGSITGDYYAGALVGFLSEGLVSNCSASCSVTAGSSSGGLVGNIGDYEHGGVVVGSHAIGPVTGGGALGGLVGGNNGVVRDCHATGAVAGTANGIGGLVGYNNGTITRCYASGAASGVYYVGGLIGENQEITSLSQSYARGSATADSVAGGLVGYNHGGWISECYATGWVTSGGYHGGILGWWISAIRVSASYWDMESSGQATSYGGIGTNTAGMLQQATYEGWDFTNVWQMTEGETTPTLIPPAAPVPETRIIGVSGVLAFGEITTGQTATVVMTITNSGNAALTVSGIAYPAGFSGAWSGILAPGEATNVTVTFSPVAAVSYSGTVTVNSDKTEGTDTLDIWGAGLAVPQPGQLCFAAATYAAQEGVKRKIVIRRINGSDGTVSVQYVTKAKTGLAGQDYVAQSGTLTWLHGQTASQTIKLAIPIDGKKEPNETFQVLLKNPVGTTLAAPAKTTVTISGNSK